MAEDRMTELKMIKKIAEETQIAQRYVKEVLEGHRCPGEVRTPGRPSGQDHRPGNLQTGYPGLQPTVPR